MRNNIFKKWITLSTTALLIGLILGLPGNAIIIESNHVSDMPAYNTILDDEYTNVTVNEAWDLLNDTANGIQIPIDVRTNEEWNDGYIDTPVPEHPRHYCLDLLWNETWLQQFMTLYNEMEVILYCAAGYRSFIATNILIDNGFSGTIYNMLDGMTGWIDEGLPTVSGGYTNITVYEAWDLLNDTANGIQIPIDVRTDVEWIDEHIDTPVPEHPRHYCLDLLQNETELQKFLSLYGGKEVILSCKSGYRSFVATRILIDNGFTGTIHNMLGGINAWTAAGFPTIGGDEDLECDGSLSWPSAKPGSTLTGYFTVENIGIPGSELDWEIIDWPKDWGDWTFTPLSGDDLTPEAGPFTVNVSVVAPDEKNKEFSGQVKIVNKENNSDNCTIDISLVTPRNRQSSNPVFLELLQKLIQKFPLLKHILSLSLLTVFNKLLNLQ